MRKILAFLFLCLLLMHSHTAKSQPDCRITRYSELNHKVWNVSYVLQDNAGFMWFTTSNGLYRFDGYEFQNFKSDVGDGLRMTSDKIKHTYQDINGNLWCLIDNRVFMFDVSTYQWIDVLARLESNMNCIFVVEKVRTLPNGQAWLICAGGTLIVADTANPSESAKVAVTEFTDTDTDICADGAGNTWLFATTGTQLYRNGEQKSYDFVCADRTVKDGRMWLLDRKGHLHELDTVSYVIKPYENLEIPEKVLGIKVFSDNRMILHSAAHAYMSIGKLSYRRIETEGRIERYTEDRNGRIWMQTASHKLYVMDKGSYVPQLVSNDFHKSTYLFEDAFSTIWLLGNDGNVSYIDSRSKQLVQTDLGSAELQGGYYYEDKQGNLWLLNEHGVFKFVFSKQSYEQFFDDKLVHVKSMLLDNKGRYWMGDRTLGTVKIFAADNSVIGYLGADGKLHKNYVRFANIYSAYQDSKGQIWLGSKPDGLFRLREQANGAFKIEHFENNPADSYSLSGSSVFCISEDNRGRIWLATHGGGINCIDNPGAEKPRFVNSNNLLARYKESYNKKTFSVAFTRKGVMLAGSNKGLMVADANVDDLSQMTIRLHQREPDRRNSLSNSYVRNIIEDSLNRVFVCTESGGVNQIVSDSLLATKLDFLHYCSHTDFPTDIAQSVIEHDGKLWVVGRNMLVRLNPDSSTINHSNAFLETEQLVFSEAVPKKLPDGRWLFGLQFGGAIALNLDSMMVNENNHRIAITSVRIHDKLYFGNSDTIVLQSNQRDLSIGFAMLDYSNTENIDYAYSMSADGHANRVYLGNTHSLAFADMRPGTYELRLYSTNGEGQWTGNSRLITIIVKPTFWETPWAWLFWAMVVGCIAYVVYLMRRYIRRINMQRQETLDAYLQLLNQNEQEQKEFEEKRRELLERNNQVHNDVFMQRVMAFIKDNLANADVNMDDMAAASASSRTAMNRKIKQMTGMTPVELLKKARLQKACQMLVDDVCSVNEVAFACGFSDPKYFSKCFKSAIGMTPTEYRLKK